MTNSAPNIAKVMFGVGGLIVHPHDPKKFLLIRKSLRVGNYIPGEWELLFGRKHEMETIADALRREAEEELGITDLNIQYPLRLWHFFRGERLPEREVIGITFVCSTQQVEPVLSSEHSDYEWVTAAMALERVTVLGIRHDIGIFDSGIKHHIHLFGPDDSLMAYEAQD